MAKGTRLGAKRAALGRQRETADLIICMDVVESHARARDQHGGEGGNVERERKGTVEFDAPLSSLSRRSCLMKDSMSSDTWWKSGRMRS
jgi:hypothetical protein